MQSRTRCKRQLNLKLQFYEKILFEGGSWYRFVVTGDVTGGRLKTPADADAESLQAKWISDLAELSLRANDVIPLVDRGRQFAMRRQNDPWYELQVIIKV